MTPRARTAIATCIGLLLVLAHLDSWREQRGLAGWLPLFGFLPVLWAFSGACLAGWAVSLATPPADAGLLRLALGGEARERVGGLVG